MNDGAILPSVHQNTQGLFAGSAKALLYLFSPRPFGQQIRRPLVYNFNDNFTNAAADAMHGQSGSLGLRMMNLMQRPEASNVIVPVATGGVFTKMADLSIYWTFLLIVNGEQPHYRMVATGFDQAEAVAALGGALKNNRAVYYGMMMDEPVNPTTLHFSTPTLNPNARLLITHKTFINQLSAIGSGGVSMPRFNVEGDVDVIDPGMLSMISAEPLHRLTPDKLLDCNDYSYDPATNQPVTVSYSGAYDELGPQQSPLSISTAYSVPYTHLSKVMTGIDQVSQSLLTNSHAGIFGNPSGVSPFLNNSADVFSHNLAERLKTEGALSHIGLQENEVISLGEIIARYDPDVQPFLINVASQWEVADQAGTDANTVFSSLILQAAPALMVNTKISEVTMEYDSHADLGRPFTLGYLANMGQAEQQFAFTAFLNLLRRELFPILKAARGDFRLYLSLQAGGISRCVLRYYADSDNTMVPYEMPTIAGGFNSNMLGSSGIAAHTGQSLGEFADVLTGRASDQLDPMASMQYANNAQYIEYTRPNATAPRWFDETPEVPEIRMYDDGSPLPDDEED
jgi:hypothetical protein